MASVILELQNAQNSELTLFLVEEPEAHLHPQLQAVLLDYLSEQANQSLHADHDRPAGRIQVIATTHSPNLASSVGIENVVVLRTAATTVASGEGEKTAERNTVAVSLVDAAVSDDERRKINQYLDVTRAELLFTRRAILVEGIAEAVLLPALARRVLSDPKERQAFRAISIISVGSVDFAPYIKLLVVPIGGVQLLDRLVVITDGDPDVTSGEPPIAGEDEDDEPAITNRRARLEGLLDAETRGALVVAESTFTLEADLLVPVDPNSGALRVAFLKQKPRSESRWQEFLDTAEPDRAFHEALRKTKNYLGKGEFAHDLAVALDKGVPFECPPYLADAIRKSLN
ncbi:MAG: ATP-dependent nuclease [Pseudonocardiaceae bacterium]